MDSFLHPRTVFLVFRFSGFLVFRSEHGATRSRGALRSASRRTADLGDGDRRVVGPQIAAVVADASGGKKDLGQLLVPSTTLELS